MKTQNLTFD